MPQTIRRVKLPDNNIVNINDYRIKIYYELEGSDNYYSVLWDVSDSTVTSYEDKMVVCAKVPIQGTDTSVGFQINNLGYKPVVDDKNTTIGGRYPVDSIVWMVYDSSEEGVLYTDYDEPTTVTGCWKVSATAKQASAVLRVWTNMTE